MGSCIAWSRVTQLEVIIMLEINGCTRISIRSRFFCQLTYGIVVRRSTSSQIQYWRAVFLLGIRNLMSLVSGVSHWNSLHLAASISESHPGPDIENVLLYKAGVATLLYLVLWVFRDSHPNAGEKVVHSHPNSSIKWPKKSAHRWYRALTFAKCNRSNHWQMAF